MTNPSLSGRGDALKSHAPKRIAQFKRQRKAKRSPQRMIANSQGRLQDRRPLSIIDIGSNSIRLVVYEGVARSPTVLFNEKMLAGLGRGLVTTGKLDPEAVQRAVAGAPPLPGAVGPGRRREAPRHRHGRGARGRERPGLHPPRRGDPRHAHPRAVGPRGGLLFGARRHFGLSPGRRHRRATSAAAAWNSSTSTARPSATASPCRSAGCACRTWRRARPSTAARIARRELERAKLLQAGEGRAFYCVGGTWRNLARLHMNVIGYPLDVMHHYELAGRRARPPSSARSPRGDIDGYQGHRAHLQEPPRAAALRRGGAARDRRGDEAGQDRRLRARRARRLPLFAAPAGGAGGRPADLGRRRARAAARALGDPCARTGEMDGRILRRLQPRRDRGRGALSARRPACWPTSAGAPIPNIAAPSR